MVRVPPGPGMSRIGPNIIGMGVRPGAPQIPGGGMTLDALIARQRQLSGQEIPLPEMQSPMQGVGYVAQQVMAGLNQGRADRDLREGREAMAGAMTQFNPDTGEFSPEAMRILGALAPDKAFTVLHDLAERRRLEAQTRAEQQFRTSERVGGQDFEAGQNDLRRQADQKRAEMEQAAGDGRQEDQQRAARELAELNSKLDESRAVTAADRARTTADEGVARGAEKIKADQQAKEAEAERMGLPRGSSEWNQYVLGTTAEKTDQWGPVPSEIASKQGGDISRNPSAYKYNARTGDIQPVKAAASPTDVQANQKLNSALIETRSQLGSVKRAMELAPNVFEGWRAKQRAEAVVNTRGVGVDEKTLQQAKDTLEYYRIMDLSALSTMSRTLSGSDSNRDVENFLRILADEKTDATQKQRQLQGLMDLGGAYERSQADAIRQSGGDPDKLTVGGGSGGGGDLPPGVTEDDIRETMRANNMTRDQVLEALRKKGGGGGT